MCMPPKRCPGNGPEQGQELQHILQLEGLLRFAEVGPTSAHILTFFYGFLLQSNARFRNPELGEIAQATPAALLEESTK